MLVTILISLIPMPHDQLCASDYDNDGHVDLAASCQFGPQLYQQIVLLKNTGLHGEAGSQQQSGQMQQGFGPDPFSPSFTSVADSPIVLPSENANDEFKVLVWGGEYKALTASAKSTREQTTVVESAP